MAKVHAMAPDSASFKVLVRLFELGGRATIADLTQVLWTEFRSTKRFKQIAQDPLVERGLVRVISGNRMAITPEGSLAVETFKRHVAPRRQSTAMVGTLNTAKYMQWGQGRPGALDYRAAPSLMAGERIAFKGAEEIDA